MVTARSKKIPNWKVPGFDGVQCYGIKNLTALHEQMADHMNDLINNRVTTPIWITTDRTVLRKKDQERGSAVDTQHENIDLRKIKDGLNLFFDKLYPVI